MLIIITIGFAIGTDYLSYEYMYNTYNQIFFTDFDIGFESIFLISKHFGLSFHMFSVIFRLAILLFTSLWIFNSSDDVGLSMIVYFSMFYFVWTMSAFRQGLVLSVALYFLFNKNKNLSLRNKIILIVLMSWIHKSSLFLIVFVLMDCVEWTKKKIITILLISLVSTLLPLGNILEFFIAIPGVDSVIYYISPGIGFFDMASLLRLFFFGVIYLNYDYLAQEPYDKKIMNVFLNGVSIYFLLKFSEISASRLTIYSFIMIVILIPKLFKRISEQIKLGRVLSVVLFSLTMTFFLRKEMVTYRSQVGYVGDMGTYDIMSIYNKDYNDFDNLYGYINNQTSKSKELSNDFRNREKIIVDIDKEMYDYVVIYDKYNYKYGVMDYNGRWVIETTITRVPYIYKNILVRDEEIKLFRYDTYIDLHGEISDKKLLQNMVGEISKENALLPQSWEEKSDIVFEDIIKEPTNFLPNVESVTNEKLYKIHENGFHYYIMSFEIYGTDNYIYLNDELEPFSNLIHTTANRYEGKFIKVPTRGGIAVYNSLGELIWFY